MQTLTTPRLTLRPWQPDDADAVLDIYSRWDVMRYIGVTPRVLEHRDEALERVERWVAADDGTHGVWAVVPREGEGTGLPDAAPSPFALDAYVPPGAVEAVEADERADALFAQALVNNQRGDNYTLTTVLFALVLFFGAFAGRFRSERASWAMVGLACVVLVVGIVFLATFPKII